MTFEWVVALQGLGLQAGMIMQPLGTGLLRWAGPICTPAQATGLRLQGPREFHPRPEACCLQVLPTPPTCPPPVSTDTGPTSGVQETLVALEARGSCCHSCLYCLPSGIVLSLLQHRVWGDHVDWPSLVTCPALAGAREAGRGRIWQGKLVFLMSGKSPQAGRGVVSTQTANVYPAASWGCG